MNKRAARAARSVRATTSRDDAALESLPERALGHEVLLAELAHDARTVRIAAVEDVGDGPDARAALRHVLGLDPDANVRAAAATRLGALRADEAVPWLREATSDPSPTVRDAAWRSLARTSDPSRETVALARRASLEEPSWWVRRSAVLALASLAGFDAIETLCAVLADPFWRVRHAAVLALAVLGDDAEVVQRQVRERAAREPMSPVAKAAFAYLQARWSHNDVPAPRASTAQRPDELLWNADPAVIAARLDDPARMRVLKPIAWVEYLAESHEALRERAVRLLAMRGDEAALRASLRWLEERRLPHAAAAVREVFRRIGLDALPIVRTALEHPERPGGVVWAAEWAAEHRPRSLRALLVARAADRSIDVRRAVAEALGALGDCNDTLARFLDDEDATVRAAACVSLSLCDEARSCSALLAREPFGDAVRAALTEAAAQRADREALRTLSRDAHPWVRARALRALCELGELDEAQLASLQRDVDPWVRAAVVGALPPSAWASLLERDRDPWVRREVIACAVRVRGGLERDARIAIAHAALCCDDPQVRARAAALVRIDRARDPSRTDEADPRAWTVVLCGVGDADFTVRSSWSERLERVGDELTMRLTQYLASDAGRAAPSHARKAAHTARARAFDLDALEHVARSLDDEREPEGVRAHLRAMLRAFDRTVLVKKPGIRARLEPLEPQRDAPWIRPAPDASVVRRPLGATGLMVTPLAVSGVGDLTPAAYEHARVHGVNTFFWEPRYTQLGRFLSSQGSARDDLVIVGGSFHADPPSIERDVRTALRRLRTDHIDVFLLFWARAPERLCDETYRCLEGLKQRGLLRAHGFSTHFRDLAVDALARHPWDVVMTRHSAAHPGAESALFPAALERRAGLLTFSATSYGRLLRRPHGAAPDAYRPTAADCYRYSAMQPGVSTVISAPRRFRELAHNLGVLSSPTLDEAQLRSLREHGARVRDENARFNGWVRAPSTVRAPREAVLALLDESDGERAAIEHWG